MQSTIPQGTAPPQPALPVGAIVALALAAMASGVSLRLADALLPRLAAEFSISIGQASQVITVFAVAYGLSQLLFGPWGDRVGKLRLISWACAASVGTSLLCALAPNFAALVGARLLAGMMAAGVIPLAMAWIGDVVPYERRQTVLARFLVGNLTGFCMGVWAGGYAAEHLDWRTPFYGVAVLFLLVAVIVHRVRRALPAGLAGSAGTAGSSIPAMAREIAAVLARPWARVVLFTVCMEGACVFGAFAFVAAHLHQRFGLPLSDVGALMMLFALGGFGFALGSQTLVRRLGEKSLVRWGAALMATALPLIAVAPAWWWVIPAWTAMGLGFYMLHNTLQTHATQMAPERRGAAVSAFAACLFLGQALGVGAAGLAVGWIGTAGVLGAAAVGIAALAWNFDHRRQALPAAPPSPVAG